MDPMSEEQLDYGEEDYGGSQKYPFAGGGGGTGGAIPALADEELMGEDDEYDDLYNDVNVGEGFIQTLQQQQAPPARSEPTAPAVAFGNGNQNPDKHGSAGVEVKDSKPEQKPAQMGNMEFQGGSLASIPPKMGIDPNFGVGVPSVAAVAPLPPPLPPSVPLNPAGPGVVGSRPSMVNDNARQVMPPVDNSGPTMLFVGDLHWWTTDAELESVMSQYGRVKEIKFFDERASGKSKGYCQVEFYESVAAAACKEGMNGYLFNGKPCVVTFASPQTLKQMASGYMNKNQGQGQTQMQGRRGMNDGVGRGGGMGFQGGDGGRNFGRGGWGGGGGPMRGRGLMGGKGMVGAAGVVGGAAGGPYGQGLAGPGLAGPAGGMMHPQGMMGAGFDPTFMGRGGPYAGFAAPAFPGMMPSFQAVNAVGLPGVAPHVNPAFFGHYGDVG
ncbi:hypothetical protein J5N97_007786 [Dioscorea zingiberensis]|uniref:RRM domain-containing protein n=1 Tax=Dioscorea zingiberensis TaxID=325984 RepID=A0A9D5HU00_9LILI|nr:hypothetical protein J5N97_007786 [Dioscorea zingiberensis]